MTEPDTPTERSPEPPTETPEPDMFPDTWDEAPERSGDDPQPRAPGDPAPAIPSQPPL